MDPLAIDESNIHNYINLPLNFNKNKPLNGIIVTKDNYNEILLIKQKIKLESMENVELESAIIGYLGSDKNIPVVIYRHAKPIPKNISLKKLVRDFYPLSWHNIFTNSDKELEKVYEVLSKIKLRNLAPRLPDIFNAFFYCPLHSVKVVIIGQDPYPGVDDATGKTVAWGMSFATRKGIKVQHSLNIVYDELEEEYSGTDTPFKKPDHGDLRPWAKQGVLLLNMSLTTLVGTTTNVHKKQWKMFLNKVIKGLCKHHERLVFMLWGGEAHKVKDLIIGSHDVLKCAHPAARETKDPFKGCGHFKLANKILVKNKKAPIDWRLSQ